MKNLSRAIILILGTACAGASHGPATVSDGNAEAKPAADATTDTTTSGVPAGTELSELEAKRLRDNITEKLPEQVERFASLCGTPATIEIDWSSVGREQEALETLYSNYGASRVVSGFESVCADKAGKDAVKGKIKRIQLVNTREKSKVQITLSGGTLTATMSWSTGEPGLNEYELAAAITKLL